jgi:hypothetical protein
MIVDRGESTSFCKINWCYSLITSLDELPVKGEGIDAKVILRLLLSGIFQ